MRIRPPVTVTAVCHEGEDVSVHVLSGQAEHIMRSTQMDQ